MVLRILQYVNVSCVKAEKFILSVKLNVIRFLICFNFSYSVLIKRIKRIINKGDL